MEGQTATLGQQLSEARNLAASGQASSALVYYEALLPQMTRLTAGTADALKQRQYSNILRSLKEEHGLLKDLDALLQDIGRTTAAAASSGRSTLDDPFAPSTSGRQDAGDEYAARADDDDHYDPDRWPAPKEPPARAGGGPARGSGIPAGRRRTSNPDDPPPRTLPPGWSKGKGGAAPAVPPAVVTTAAPRRRPAGQTAAGSSARPAYPTRSDSALKRPLAGGAPAAAGCGKAGPGAASAASAAAPHRAEYSGPDGDLAANLERDMLDRSPGIRWSDIAGLTEAKRVLEEATVLPLIMPDFFTGIRRPVKGVMLFGPPGTGKTMLAKAVATECGCTFFNVSSATLASKYRGESERMVRCLFALARACAPSIIFIDEVDSLCTQRGAEGEHEASRRVKSELLVQIDGCHATQGEERQHVVVLAATNFPWDIDEALRRRLEKRIYIPLPGEEERKELLKINLQGIDVAADVDFQEITRQLAGYSGDDITNICRDAAMNGMRRKIAGKSAAEIREMSKDALKEPVTMEDCMQAIAKINPSVSPKDVKRHEDWVKVYGSV